MTKNTLKVNVSKCPICSKETLIERITTIAVPHFGEVLLLTLQCKSCGFKHSDVICTSEGDPSRYSLKVETPQDLYAKVIRSSTATIRIPELGVKIEPGPASSLFITNIEGVLQRIENVVKMAKRWSTGKTKQKKCEKILNTIENVKIGKEKVTVIIEDPFGNSIIVHSQKDKVRKEKLTENEIKKLKTGLIVMPVKSLKRKNNEIYGNGINP